MANRFTESTVEEAVLEWAEGLAYAVLYGPDIAPEEPATERESFGEVLLLGRLRAAVERINPKVPSEARDEAIRRVIRTESPSPLENNRRFHQMLVDGIDVEYQSDGRTVAVQRNRIHSASSCSFPCAMSMPFSSKHMIHVPVSVRCTAISSG